ncbi:putative rho GDP-dissociation inhibitor 1 [Schistocerca gregaria]|uniref:putative rho GDP-dissociation inhibitor 1 n=1 Tax=Schistocerca gregaria TaxID=7010 RepID=UPI00211F0A21|nr:putative rho GDP-dissociation inhibitor 1 [Schistocerca gregaria]
MGNEDDSENSYKVPTKVGINDILNQDKDDAALENYKKQLLGVERYSPRDDPRRVVIVEMHVIFENRPSGDISFCELDQSDALNKLKNEKGLVFKEGCKYKLKFVFRVQHDIVTGLHYVNKVYKAKSGIRVAKEMLMLGSYPPQEKTHEVVYPRNGWEKTPSGMLARGSYRSTIAFIDDDNVTHLKFEYNFSIRKDWASEDDS